MLLDIKKSYDFGPAMKSFAEHGRKVHPKPRFLVTTEAQLSAVFGPSLHLAFVVQGLNDLFGRFEVMNFHKLPF